MSTERDVTRIVESWLEEGVAVLPDRVLDAVVANLPSMPQRRFRWLARRFSIMTTTVVRLGVAAAAVIMAVFLGYNLLSGSNVGTPVSSTPPTEAPTDTPTATATPVSGTPGKGEAMAPGRYHLYQVSTGYTFEISSDLWQGSREWNGIIETRHTALDAGYAWITFMNRLNAVSIDPCAGTQTSVSSVDEAATALTQIAGTDAVGPTDVTIDGVPAKLVELTIHGDMACDRTSFWLYGDGSFYPNSPDSVIRAWIFDRKGQTVLFHTDMIGPDAALGDDIKRIVDSIQFD